MADVKTELINTLKEFEYPVRLQGSLAKDEAYPESFFTIWNNETEDGNHYDNEPISYVWDFTVCFYSASPALVNTVLIRAVDELKKGGWIIGGRGYDVPTDEPSHTGRAIDVLFIEKN